MTDIQTIPANQIPARFYRGGHKIDDFRGSDRGDDFRPEDWIASVTPLAGQRALGLSTLSSGELLVDAIANNDTEWLGHDHLAAFGRSTMILVKLLDAGQRLPVHAHPNDEFARSVLHHTNGKAEAWYILSPGEIYLGLQQAITRNELREIVMTQDTSTLLSLLHTRSVAPGDTVFVPAGELHAIGEGVLLLEIQQPADLSILLEWDGFVLDGLRDGHLGVGFEKALEAVSCSPRTAAEVESLIVRGPVVGPALVGAAAEFFRLERVVVSGSTALARGFAILIGETGSIDAESTRAKVLLERGTTAVLPNSAGAVRLHGSGSVLVCRPPLAPNSSR